MAIRAEFLNPRFVKIVDIHVRCCEVCQQLTGTKETVYHTPGGAMYCVKGHKLTGKNNDLHLLEGGSSSSNNNNKKEEERKSSRRREDTVVVEEEDTDDLEPETSKLLKQRFVKMLRMGLTTRDLISYNKKLLDDAIAKGFISQDHASSMLPAIEKIVRTAAVEVATTTTTAAKGED